MNTHQQTPRFRATFPVGADTAGASKSSVPQTYVHKLTRPHHTDAHSHHSSLQAVREKSAGGTSSRSRLAPTQLYVCAEGDAKLSRPIGEMINGQTFGQRVKALAVKAQEAFEVAAFWFALCFLVTMFAVVVAG